MNNTELQDPPPYSLQWFEENIAILRHKESKLLFENDRTKSQESPCAPKTFYVVEWFKHHERYDIQVTFPLEVHWSNNHFIIYIYIWEADEILMFSYKSHTVYPPVWDRSFSLGPDYYDYIGTQRKVNSVLKSRGLPEFAIDTDYEGKVVNTTKETPDEIRKLLSEGKSYGILSIWAKTFFENAKLVSVKKTEELN